MGGADESWVHGMRGGAVCAAFGVVITVFVAWLGAATATQPGAANGPTFVPVRRGLDEPGRPIERFVAMSPGSRNVGTGSGSVARGWIVKCDQYLLIYVLSPGAPGGPSRTVDVYSAGWPLPALEWTDMPFVWLVNAAPPPSTAWERAWELGIEYRGRGGPPGGTGWDEAWRRLPIRPAGGGVGLMVDVVLWGCVTAAGLQAIAGVRRRRRRQRGLCEGCGYPTRDAGGRVLQQCPECGQATPPAPQPESPA